MLENTTTYPFTLTASAMQAANVHRDTVREFAKAHPKGLVVRSVYDHMGILNERWARGEGHFQTKGILPALVFSGGDGEKVTAGVHSDVRVGYGAYVRAGNYSKVRLLGYGLAFVGWSSEVHTGRNCVVKCGSQSRVVMGDDALVAEGGAGSNFHLGKNARVRACVPFTFLSGPKSVIRAEVWEDGDWEIRTFRVGFDSPSDLEPGVLYNVSVHGRVSVA